MRVTMSVGRGGGYDGYYNRKTMASNVRTRTTAMVLRAVLRLRRGHQLESGAVDWLMTQRERYGWGNTNETAYTILALTDYLLAYQAQADGAAVIVEVDGVKVGTATLDDESINYWLEIPVADLQPGENAIQLRSDAAASLHYVISSNLLLPQREIETQGIAIRRSTWTPITGRSKTLWRAS